MAASDPMASLNALLQEDPKSGEAASSSSSADKEPLASLTEVDSLASPEIVICGATLLEAVGDNKKTAAVKESSLYAPHRLAGTALDDTKILNVITGPSSNHCFALTDKGVFAWGKNHRGQLGVGDDQPRNMPTLVAALSKEKIVHAATGKAHSIFITAKGEVYAAGCNKFGTVGPSVKKKQETAPKPILVPGITGAVRAACGADFSMVVTKSGALYSFGWSEFGQLGHGTDGQFNQSASSVKMTFEAERSPERVQGVTNVVQVACGPHHSCALQADGTALTWGSGGYGRLGHNDQADQWRPKALPNFLFRSVACGNAWTCGVGWRVYNMEQRPTGGGMLHMMGRLNPNKDSAMYPKPEYDVQGWEIQHMACGNTHIVLAADGSTIAWGSGTGFGELGLGSSGAKSSAKPKKVDDLEGANVGAVAAGSAQTLWLVEANACSRGLPDFTPPQDTLAAPEPKGAKGKRAAPAASKAKGKKAKK